VKDLALDNEMRVKVIRAAMQKAPWTTTGDEDLETARERLSITVPTAAGNLRCWPSVPKGLSLEAARLLESEAGPDAEEVDYPVGARDHVVVAVPVSCLSSVAGDLVAARPTWQAMVAKLGTVATQSAQLWCTRPLRAQRTRRGRPPAAYLVGGYVEPFDTWADMSHLLSSEQHDPRAGVVALAYLCNTLPDPQDMDADQDAEADDLVRRNVRQFIVNDSAAFWTNAARAVDGEGSGADGRDLSEFDWDALAFRNGSGDLSDEAEQLELLVAHYVRANVRPTDRYVQSLPSTVRYRLRPDRSGFPNVYLAGDWTYCGLNSGCIEAAVTSGMIAARAISPRLDVRIPGWPYRRDSERSPR
jgi:hypothetical protein